MTQDHKKKMQEYAREYVLRCSDCNGRGFNRCDICEDHNRCDICEDPNRMGHHCSRCLGSGEIYDFSPEKLDTLIAHVVTETEKKCIEVIDYVTLSEISGERNYIKGASNMKDAIRKALTTPSS